MSRTRERILTATRDLLSTSSSFAQISIPAIARAADVARDTVYRQFGSRSGLLEAVFDDGAERGGLGRLVDAVSAPSAVDGLDLLVGVFCDYWSGDLATHRALRGLAALDADLGAALQARDARRHTVLSVLVDRVVEQTDPTPAPLDPDRRGASIDLLHVLTSFATYDQLGASRSVGDVCALLQRTTHDVLQLRPAGVASTPITGPPGGSDGSGVPPR